MLKAILISLAAIPLLVIGLLLSSTFVVVDVNTADGPHIIVPIPLALAQTALSFAPIEARELELPELTKYAPLAQELLHEIRAIPDAVLVEVDDGDNYVLIEKVGDEIALTVHERSEEKVNVSIPLVMLEEMFESYDGETLELRDVLRSLSSVSNQDLVHVKDGDDEVKVWVW